MNEKKDEKKEMGQEPAIGLVLEGGGMRGIYTAGVLDVFLEHGITFDGVIGVSAGAIHGCTYVSGQAGRNIRYYKNYCKDKRFMSLHNMLRTGDLVDEEFCYHELPEILDPYDYQAFKRSPIHFYVTCSNVETGKAEHFRITDLRTQVDLLRASASLPYVSKIVEYDGKKLLDGGCTDSIPVHAFLKMGYKMNVVVLTRPREYVKEPEHIGLSRLWYGKYPKFAAAIERRHKTYNNTRKLIRRLEEDGKVFVICPEEPLSIGRSCHDPDLLQQGYDIGRQDALRRLGNLEVFLAKSRR